MSLSSFRIGRIPHFLFEVGETRQNRLGLTIFVGAEIGECVLCQSWSRARLGLTPKDHSTGGKTRLGGITRAGDELLRSTLVVGTTAVIQHVRRTKGKNASPWLISLLERKKPKQVAVALANKIARIAWRLMISGEAYRWSDAHTHAAVQVAA